jgi:uncharacterized phage protein (TIGR01671 family)
MREIKFRVWQHHKGNDDTGWFQYYKLNEFMDIEFLKSDIKRDIEPDRNFYKENRDNVDSAIMQYTGLLDKNGKEIYEEDILKEDCGTIWLVEWYKTGLVIKCKRPKTDEIFFTLSESADIGILEIIGNIYENSSLLNK